MKEQLKQLIESENFTKADVAKKIGIDRSTLSNYINENVEKISKENEDKIINFLETFDFKEMKKIDRDFFETNDVIKALTICKECQDKQLFGMITGKSGFGKTTVLKKYASLKKVAYVRCNVTMRNIDIFDEIEDALNIQLEKTNNSNKRLKQLEKFFRNNQGYLIILDEADKFVNRNAVSRMETIRDIYDLASVGVIIAGEQALKIELEKHIQRCANRIDLQHEFKGLSRDEVTKYVKDLNITEKAIEELIVRATNRRNGCFRLLDRTLKNLSRILKNDEQITYKMIVEASDLMLL